MKISLLEPYYTGSHMDWADELERYSSHEIQLFTMPGEAWKWRMHGGAVTLAGEVMRSELKPDLILATDMLDLNAFLGLTRKKTAKIPTAIYFHENQLSYPWKPEDRDILKNREWHYKFINFISAYTADAVFFNSNYHKDTFLEELKKFLLSFPDNNELQALEQIKSKSSTLPLGLELKEHAPRRTDRTEPPIILWNHRWEHDKAPEAFCDALIALHNKGLDFEVAFLGESPPGPNEHILKAKKLLGNKVTQFGYVKNKKEYFGWLDKARILPVTSKQDFFGASVVQAVHHGCMPLLPKRLAYPEMIPIEQYPDCYYSGKKDLLKKLETLIRRPLSNDTLSSSMERFDWSRSIKRYDKAFSEVVTKACMS